MKRSESCSHFNGGGQQGSFPPCRRPGAVEGGVWEVGKCHAVSESSAFTCEAVDFSPKV